ncbi:TylF/MycF/NovP-related O-methyltransferase [Sphingomonas faeni]|uniref:TylF/MycF/NovP-related O-methyltransferase n=1 Tax=Sphingomonas faeni TaxID=185950 RepID=UPI0024133492|nr:TylF/MycF/NovP-related O-methyltransferase [Sphingomonas faeni]
MRDEDCERLKEKLVAAVVHHGPKARVAIVGWSHTAFDVANMPIFTSGAAELVGIFGIEATGRLNAFPSYRDHPVDIVVIAEDAGKELLLEEVAQRVPATTRLLIGGYEHFKFRDAAFDQITRSQLVPSLANGYPNCLVHIYQCLTNAYRRGLTGVVAEFGMFKGGTTMLMSQFIESIGAPWKIYGFDTFGGFPARRSPLDMYDHPDCVFLDVEAVRAMFAQRNVEIVTGDVVDTVQTLKSEDLVLSFVDTDNFTSANAVLDVIADRTQVNGVIIFDHWAGDQRFVDTIGERLAARRLAEDARYFNLHGTGVFFRQA